VKHIEISRQKAVAICKKESLSFRALRNDTQLLKTLAKLYRRNDGSFHIGGYAYDGSDVAPYEGK
jgi:hypothetical protein